MALKGEDLIARHVELDPLRPWPDEARLRDSCVPVWAVIGYLEVLKGDADQVAAGYHVPPEAVRAAVAYYFCNKQAIDARIQANRSVPAAWPSVTGFSIAENKAVVRRLIEEVFSRGNLDVADELVAADYVDHYLTPRFPPGVESLKQSCARFSTVFGDLTITVEDLFGEGDTVGARTRHEGVHRGEFMGLPPTGRRVAWEELHVFRVVGGKVVERWLAFDTLWLIQQLGPDLYMPEGSERPMRGADLPAHVARAVTDAVEAFAKQQDAEAISWNHDEPIWFVRTFVDVSPADRVDQRVQIAAFEPASPRQATRLHILPDPYRLDPGNPSPTRRRLIDLAKWAETVEIYDTHENPLSYDQIRRQVEDSLLRVWGIATKLP